MTFFSFSSAPLENDFFHDNLCLTIYSLTPCYVSLRYNNIGPAGAQAIANALEKHKTLTELL